MLTSVLALSQHLAKCEQCRRAIEAQSLVVWQAKACLIGQTIHNALPQS